MEGCSDLSCSIVVRPRNKITGRVKVLGLGKEYLEGSIYPVIYSWLPSSIAVKVDGHTDLVGSLTPSYPQYSQLYSSIEPRIISDLQADLIVKPINRMSGTVSVIEPPYEVTEILPIQDATIRRKVPTLNYGIEDQLVVGASYDDTLRSLLKFTAESLPEYHVIRNVYLKLEHVIPIHSEQLIELWQVAQSWGEYNTTWNNQPSASELFTTFTVKPGSSNTLVNITELYREWLESGSGEGLLLKQSSETANTVTYFSSREGTAPPKILVEHYDSRILFSLGRGSMSGDLITRAMGSSDLVSSLSVHSFGEEADLAASIIVPEYFNEENLAGSISARNPKGAADLISSIGSRVLGQSSLAGSLTVLQIADFQGYLDVKNPSLPGYLVVIQSNLADLNCSLDVWRISDLDSGITVIQHAYSDLGGSLSVCRYGAGLLESDIICRSNWYKELLEGSLAVRQSTCKDLSGSLITSLQGQSDLAGDLYVREKKDLHGYLYVRAAENTELEGSISARVAGQDSLIGDVYTRPYMDMPGSIFVINFINSDLVGSITPQYSGINDLSGDITVEIPSNLEAYIAVAKSNCNDLAGSVIPQYSGTCDMPGDITAMQNTSLEGSIYVVYVGQQDLSGVLVARVKFIGDLHSTIIVNSEFGPYAFIM